MNDRKTVLLRAAYDLLKRNEQSEFVQSAMETLAFYDDADCDGFCLMEDIRFELRLEEATEPLPLKNGL